MYRLHVFKEETQKAPEDFFLKTDRQTAVPVKVPPDFKKLILIENF